MITALGNLNHIVESRLASFEKRDANDTHLNRVLIEHLDQVLSTCLALLAIIRTNPGLNPAFVCERARLEANTERLTNTLLLLAVKASA